MLCTVEYKLTARAPTAPARTAAVSSRQFPPNAIGYRRWEPLRFPWGEILSHRERHLVRRLDDIPIRRDDDQLDHLAAGWQRAGHDRFQHAVRHAGAVLPVVYVAQCHETGERPAL